MPHRLSLVLVEVVVDVVHLQPLLVDVEELHHVEEEPQLEEDTLPLPHRLVEDMPPPLEAVDTVPHPHHFPQDMLDQVPPSVVAMEESPQLCHKLAP